MPAAPKGSRRFGHLLRAALATACGSLCCTWVVAAAASAPAQPAAGAEALPPGPVVTAVAFPYYRAEHALQGLYGQHAPPLWQRFADDAAALSHSLQQHCAGQAPLAEVQQAWRATRLAWVAAATPALGPVLERRSAREVDFWPMRLPLLQRALATAPSAAGDLVRVGGPAKGLPALEWLLGVRQGDPKTSAPKGRAVTTAAPIVEPAHCHYARWVAAHLADEALALRQAFASPEALTWQTDDEATRAAFGQWINQWLGGLESLRWQQIEQPLHKARTASPGGQPVFARALWSDNLADWQAQWASLLAQARLPVAQGHEPPRPGRDLVPIDALLIGQGQLALAARWRLALDAVSTDLTALAAPNTPARQPNEARLMALAARMKVVATLYQQAVAPALDVPLGFSSADGD